ncbi:hypothetical protein [Synoicihabitans lomoniglobus]|uniref:PilN domain-containing protein n=1 Tax=Synoicihabitans lomoniglobus TaxID=2909285 RepID=A0AAE9ZYC8_9BACT|nr:hypothetical protein [Opitutaceae bacterium LMO-M01]WED65459.1 hypothetical protein PXH66_01175 [Opitutaceae bacterium LMO-M01]
MLSKLKNKTESATSKLPAWHLDFRNTDRLPDVKPIRTAFFINVIAILIAAATLFNFGSQEMQIYSMNAEISRLEDQIAKDQYPSAAAVKLFKEFQADEKKINEVAEFVKAPLKLSTFMLHLGEILPENIMINSVDWRGSVITLRGVVSGTPDEASGYASGLVATLDEDELFGPLFSDAALTSLIRNPTTGKLAMEIRLEFTGK